MLTYRIELMRSALPLNLLVLYVVVTEAMGLTAVFHFPNDCVAAYAMAIAFGSTFLPLLVAWVLPSRPVPVRHYLAVFIYVVLIAFEGFLTFFVSVLCNGLGPLFG